MQSTIWLGSLAFFSNRVYFLFNIVDGTFLGFIGFSWVCLEGQFVVVRFSLMVVSSMLASFSISSALAKGLPVRWFGCSGFLK